MTANRSMTDVAYELLKQNQTSLEFRELWSGVRNAMGYEESMAMRKIGQFHNDIMLDNRFASLENNKWDLKSRRKFEETHIDTSAIIIEDDEDADESDLDENEEEKEADEEY